MIVGIIGLFMFLNNGGNHDATEKSAPNINADSIAYTNKKASIESERKKLYLDYTSKKISMDSVSKIFTQRLVNGIIPYWYGTNWDFNGYTDVPGEGVIACGYFVSTTLKHVGIRVNRYKMAQKSAMDGALMLEPKSNLEIKYIQRDTFIKYVNTHKQDGLYMLGLSNHVGYIYKSEGEVYFLHSTFLTPGKVVCEKAMASEAMRYSTVFVLADITHNEALMLKWLKGEILPH